MDARIAAEIATALELLEAHPELAGSWGDTLSDEAVLEMLKAWNDAEPATT
jgi:hypothetical protein